MYGDGHITSPPSAHRAIAAGTGQVLCGSGCWTSTRPPPLMFLVTFGQIHLQFAGRPPKFQFDVCVSMTLGHQESAGESPQRRVYYCAAIIKLFTVRSDLILVITGGDGGFLGAAES